jgi:hypothetical protein
MFSGMMMINFGELRLLFGERWTSEAKKPKVLVLNPPLPIVVSVERLALVAIRLRFLACLDVLLDRLKKNIEPLTGGDVLLRRWALHLIRL